MDVEEIRKLVRLMEEAGLTELEVEDRSGKIRLVRGAVPRARAGDPAPDHAEREPAPRDDATLASTPSFVRDEPSASDGDGQGELPPGHLVVTSPMVGTFYRAPAPDAAPFVSEGDVVQPGQVLCIIEAMKMMNEIHAETPGRIVSIEAENGTPVEYGSPLFVLAALE
ncbi:MAG TPA: acetyl-CoA carboxylase biotin carboxyl carrier protein [Candidatus Binatia bacterium]